MLIHMQVYVNNKWLIKNYKNTSRKLCTKLDSLIYNILKKNNKYDYMEEQQKYTC
jgi:hypothetical protein